MKFDAADMYVFGGAALLLGLIGILVVAQPRATTSSSTPIAPRGGAAARFGDHALQAAYAAQRAAAPGEHNPNANDVVPYPNGVTHG